MENKSETTQTMVIAAVCPLCHEEMDASKFAAHLRKKHPEVREARRGREATTGNE